MKTIILRLVIGVILLSVVASIVVALIGATRGWQTAAQFSDGFFWAGIILIAIGFISYQGYRRRAPYWSWNHLDPAQRSAITAADTFRGKNLLIFFGVSGLLLFGLSFLVLKLF